MAASSFALLAANKLPCPNMSFNLPLENSAEIGREVLQRLAQQKEITSLQNLVAQPFTLHMLEKSIQHLKEMISSTEGRK